MGLKSLSGTESHVESLETQNAGMVRDAGLKQVSPEY